MGMTSFPLYVPQVGQTWWGSLGAWHCGQADARTGFRKSCALLMFLLDLECLFIGFGIISYSFFPSLLFLGLNLELLQDCEPLIKGFGLTATGGHIHIDTAMGAQPLTGLHTQGLNRDLQEDLFKDQRVQINGILFVIREIKILGAQLPLLLRPVRRRRKGIFERGADRQCGRRQTAAAGRLHGRGRGPFDKDRLLHPPDGAGNCDPVQEKIGRFRFRKKAPEPFPILFKPEIHPPFGDLAYADLQKLPFPDRENDNFPLQGVAV